MVSIERWLRLRGTMTMTRRPGTGWVVESNRIGWPEWLVYAGYILALFAAVILLGGSPW